MLAIIVTDAYWEEVDGEKPLLFTRTQTRSMKQEPTQGSGRLIMTQKVREFSGQSKGLQESPKDGLDLTMMLDRDHLVKVLSIS